MPLNLTYHEYYVEVRSIADAIAEECVAEAEGDRASAEDLTHDRLHESVDGHELVIYYAGNDTILRHSTNGEAWQDCYSNADMGAVVAKEGLDKVKTIQAFFALEADVREVMDDALDDAVEAWEASHKAEA